MVLDLFMNMCECLSSLSFAFSCTVPVWKVARYTSAAPVYFTECDNYVDGGVKANNPCDYALTMIQVRSERWGNAEFVMC